MFIKDRFYEFFSKKLSSGGSGGSGEGDMKKSVYDINLNSIVDKAENLNDGINNISTIEVKNHLDDEEIKHNTFSGTGFLNSTLITYNGLGSLTVDETEGLVYENSNHSGNLKKVTFAQTDLTIDPEDTYYLIGDYNSGTPIFRITADVEEVNESNIIPHSRLFLNSSDEIHIMDWHNLGSGKVDKIHERIVRSENFKKESGMTVSYNSANSSISAITGKYWYGAVRKTFSEYNSIDNDLRFYYHLVGEWTWDDSRNDIETLKYDNGTDLVNVANGEYVNIFIYTCCEDNKNKLYYVLGNRCEKYANALSESIPTLPKFLSSYGILLSVLTFQKGVIEPVRTVCDFSSGFNASIPTTHSDLSGLTTGDIHPANTIYTDITNFDNILSSSEDDIQKALDVLDDHTHNLNSIDDVSITSISSGDIVKFTGTVFENVDDEKIIGISLGSKGVDLTLESSFPLVIPFIANIKKVIAQVNSAPTGSNLIIDININGTSIWNTTQSNRVTIADGSLSGNQIVFDNDSISENDVITVDIDQFGSTTTGQDLSIFIILKRL